MDFNKSRIFADDLDEKTINQFKQCIELPFVTDSALMPDAHFGYVAPIGSVILTRGVIVPSWVGYDIGCGVIALKIKGKNLLTKVKKYSKEIFSEVRKNLPMGLGKLSAEHKISKENKEKFKEILNKLKKKKIDENIFKFIKRKGISNLGSLGHGNHFAEISYYKNELWIVVHCGSRNIGHKVATHYMRQAMQAALLSSQKESENSASSTHGETGDMKKAMGEALLSSQKESENSASSTHGETGEGDSEKTFELKANSKIGKEYLAVQEFLLEFALLNRIEIAKKIKESIENVIKEEIKMDLWTNKNHNHVIKYAHNKWIHRKGATPSKKGERGVIPANMKDGSFLVTGKGNKKFIESSSHGAGRRMSKKDAKEKFKLNEFEKNMKGITASVRKETIDESPNAYKNISQVLKNQKESIKIVKHLKPLINFKGY